MTDDEFSSIASVGDYVAWTVGSYGCSFAEGKWRRVVNLSKGTATWPIPRWPRWQYGPRVRIEDAPY